MFLGDKVSTAVRSVRSNIVRDYMQLKNYVIGYIIHYIIYVVGYM